MTMKRAERVFFDTDILLAATDEGRPEHRSALAALHEWPGAGTTLYMSGQVVREYLSVATRPTERNGLGLSRTDAMSNARAFRGRLRLLEENVKVADQLLALIDTVDCTGKQVHDANIVATMLAHGVRTLVTLNASDFARFEPLVKLAELS
jgi:predicted nucleic acid-binding protein